MAEGVNSIFFRSPSEPFSLTEKALNGTGLAGSRIREQGGGLADIPDLLDEDEFSFKEGKIWEVVIIRAGLSKNNNNYPADVLRLAVPMFEGVKAFADHATEAELRERPERTVRDLIGWFTRPRFDESVQGIVSTFVLLEFDVQSKMRQAWELGNKNFIEFSIDASAKGVRNEQGGLNVEEIVEVASVDAVTFASAGGEAVRLIQSHTPGSPFRRTEVGPMKKRFLALLKRINEALAKKLKDASAEDLFEALKKEAPKIKDAKLKAKVAEVVRAIESEDPPKETGDGEGDGGTGEGEGTGDGEGDGGTGEGEGTGDGEGDGGTGEGEGTGDGEGKEAVKEAKKKTAKTNGTVKLSESDRRLLTQTATVGCQALLDRKLKESKLPDLVQAHIRESDRFKGIFEEKDLDAELTSQRKLWGRVSESGQVRGAGMGRAEFGEDDVDKIGHAMDGLLLGQTIEGVKPFNSLKQAYVEITGGQYLEDPAVILAESYPAHMQPGLSARAKEAMVIQMHQSHSIRESLTTASWAQILGDSVTRSMQREFAIPGLDEWRLIVSDVMSVNDFRTQRRMIMGGYGDLPAVSQGGTYLALTSPADEEVSYAITKRGGTEDLTLETIADDDVRAVRRIPQKLGRTAAITLYKFVFDFIVDNPLWDVDAIAVFDAATHNNLTTAALSTAEMDTIRAAMRSQAAQGAATEILGLVPKLLLVPNELEHLALRLTASPIFVDTTDTGTTPVNVHQREGIRVIVLDYWTDANDYALIADPRRGPTIEIGFFQGRQEPELYVQDNPTVGSVFAQYKITYKIRHIYGGDVLDYRGMAKAVVA